MLMIRLWHRRLTISRFLASKVSCLRPSVMQWVLAHSPLAIFFMILKSATCLGTRPCRSFLGVFRWSRGQQLHTAMRNPLKIWDRSSLRKTGCPGYCSLDEISFREKVKLFSLPRENCIQPVEERPDVFEVRRKIRLYQLWSPTRVEYLPKAKAILMPRTMISLVLMPYDRTNQASALKLTRIRECLKASGQTPTEASISGELISPEFVPTVEFIRLTMEGQKLRPSEML